MVPLRRLMKQRVKTSADFWSGRTTGATSNDLDLVTQTSLAEAAIAC